MGTENSGPSPGLAGLMGQYGGASLSGGDYADPQDLPLIVKRERRTPGAGEFTMQEEAQFLYGGVPADYTREFPTVQKESEAEKAFYSMDRKDVSELQHRLWAGGFYPPGVDPTEIALGDYDEYTFKAYQTAIHRAAMFHASGVDKTLNDVIDEAANIEGADARNKASRGRAPLVTELTNPEDLRYYAQKTAVATLGRSLRPDELERFVSSFHASQTASQTAAYNAGGTGGPGGTVVNAPNPSVAAEAFARQEAPAEAGAHDFVKVYDVVSRVLSGRRGRG